MPWLAEELGNKCKQFNPQGTYGTDEELTSVYHCISCLIHSLRGSWLDWRDVTTIMQLKHFVRGGNGFLPMRLLIVSLLSTAQLAVADPATAPASPGFAQKADVYLQGELKAERFAGSVMVAQSNQIVFMKGYGLANRELDVTNTPSTKFRLGSITKQFTAMCVLILQEQGKLSVEDPISKFVRDCPSGWSKIKIRHLLTHTSGIPDYTKLPEYISTTTLGYPAEKMVKWLRDKALEFEPGERFEYSNSGYVLLGFIVEKASGQSYEQFMQEFVFKPLGMKASGCDHFERILPRRASGYTPDGESWVNSAYVDTTYPHGDGALYSTVADFFHWYQCWREKKLVSASSWKSMTSPVKENYGYGIAIVEPFGQKEFAHDGRVNGFVASMRWLPSSDIFVAAFANTDSAHSGEVADGLVALLLDKPLRQAKEKTGVKLDAGQLERLAGRYAFAENPAIVTTITASGDRLFSSTGGQPKLELIAESETNFCLKEMPEIQVTFWKDASGKVDRFVSQLNGVGHEAKRINERE